MQRRQRFSLILWHIMEGDHSGYDYLFVVDIICIQTVICQPLAVHDFPKPCNNRIKFRTLEKGNKRGVTKLASLTFRYL